MRNLAADAMSQEPIDLFSIPRPIVAPELISGEAEPNVERYLDARFLPDLATSSICGALALLDVALGKSPFMTASYQKTRPLVDHDRTCRVVKDVSSPRRDHCVHSVASKNKDGLRTRSPEAITRVSGKLRELHRAFNCHSCYRVLGRLATQTARYRFRRACRGSGATPSPRARRGLRSPGRPRRVARESDVAGGRMCCRGRRPPRRPVAW